MSPEKVDRLVWFLRIAARRQREVLARANPEGASTRKFVGHGLDVLADQMSSAASGSELARALDVLDEYFNDALEFEPQAFMLKLIEHHPLRAATETPVQLLERIEREAKPLDARGWPDMTEHLAALEEYDEEPSAGS